MRLFPLFLFVFLCQLLPAQRWTVGAQWIYYQYEFMSDPLERYVIFTKTKDTTILQRSCSVLREVQKSRYQGEWTINSVNWHYLAHDSLITEQYWPDSSKFLPLYDLGKMTGDTVYAQCAYGNELFRARVDSVYMDTMGSRPLRAQLTGSHLGEWPNCEWRSPTLEYVGNLYYLFPSGQLVDFGPGGELICFQDSTLSYPAGAICDESILNTPCGCLGDSPDLLFPNPTHDEVRWEQMSEYVCVYDFTGRLVLEQTQTRSLSLGHLPTGTYIVWMRTEKGFRREKVMKW